MPTQGMSGEGKKPAVVLIAINDLLVGGAQKIVLQLLQNLDRSRFTPVLLTLFHFPESTKAYLYADIPNGVRSHHLHFGGFIDVASWIRLVKLLHAERPDVVLSNLFFSNTVLRVLQPFFGYSIITVEHNTYTEKKWWERIADRVLACITGRIVAVSRTVAEFTAAQEHIRRDKFAVIHNGIDCAALEREACIESSSALLSEEFGIRESERVIINVARVVPQKNHTLLIDGFAIFTLAHPEYHLFIVGGGSHFEKTRQYAEHLGLRKVHFLGYRRDVPQLLAASDFFVSTSRIEGFGIAHAEALACGIPVLTTKTAGPDEMIHDGINGFFITEHTPRAVADGLERMIHANLVVMGREAKVSVQQFSVGSMIKKYESLIYEVLRGVRQ